MSRTLSDLRRTAHLQARRKKVLPDSKAALYARKTSTEVTYYSVIVDVFWFLPHSSQDTIS